MVCTSTLSLTVLQLLRYLVIRTILSCIRWYLFWLLFPLYYIPARTYTRMYLHLHFNTHTHALKPFDIHTHTHTHIHTHTHTLVPPNIRTHTHFHTHTHTDVQRRIQSDDGASRQLLCVRVHVHHHVPYKDFLSCHWYLPRTVQVCMYVCLSVCVCVCAWCMSIHKLIYVSVYACVCVWICVKMYVWVWLVLLQ